jgi:hypothetical protein
MASELTKKQNGFINDVIKLGNATQAAKNNYKIKSKNIDNVAGAIGSENLRKPKIKKEIAPFLEELITERNRAIKAMKLKNLDQVTYDKLSKVIDELTKNIQLLGGKPTEKVIINKSLNDDEFDELMKIYESRKISNSNGNNKKVS